MNTNPLSLILTLLLLLPLTTTHSPSLQKFVQISPSAFDVMVHAFDQLVVLFHSTHNHTSLNQTLQTLEALKFKINLSFPNDHTLFGYVNITQDYANLLDKYSKQPGLILLDRFSTSQPIFNLEDVGTIFQLYEDTFHPRLPLAYRNSIKQSTKYPHSLVFTFKNSDQLAQYNLIYKRIIHFLQDLQVSALAVPAQPNTRQSIQLYLGQSSINQYKFDENMTVPQKAGELLQDINIHTLPVVNVLQQSNMQRVFGGSISDQLLLIHKPANNTSQLQRIRTIFRQAAIYNKQEQLTYERVLFCEVDADFYDQQFNQQSSSLFEDESGNSSDFVIMFTKTDYDKFNLKRYLYKNNQSEPTVQSLVGFIEDVRMKRLDPQYRSEPIPSQSQNNGVLRKIVGNSFISEVYERPDQSVIILFIDSKDESSYRTIKQELENFAHKHRFTFQKKLMFGIFDLDKNEHKLLYLKQAPQIVLFDKANKKQTKYYRLYKGINDELLKEWVNTEVSNVKIIESIDL